VDRPISSSESAVIEWLLHRVPVGDVSAYRGLPLEDLRVIDGCQCGCSSLDFVPNAWGGARIIADGIALYEDGQQAGLILWGKEGKIALLEVYDMHEDSSHRLPEVAHLNAWDQSRR
jgi:hypothetical protein